jgi:tetratricopeptide (TPR) repeat protein
LAVVVAQQDTRLMARASDLLGRIAVDREDYVRARERFEQSVRLYRELGNEHGTAASLGNLGITLQQLGEGAQSEQLLQEAQAILRRCGDAIGVAALQLARAHGAYMQQQWAEAAAQYRESLAALQAFGAQRAIAECLEGLGWVAQVAGPPERAARLWGAAATVRQATGIPRAPFLVPLHQHAEAAGRAALGEAAFAAAWAAGQALSLEEAIAFALESPPPA